MRIAILAALLAVAGIGPALAQDEPAPAPPVQVAQGCSIDGSLLDQALIVICAEATVTNDNGQFVEGAYYVQGPSGEWIRLTPCDDLIVACDTLWIRAEGAVQGDSMVLRGVE